MSGYLLFASVWFVAAATPGADTMLLLTTAISRGWRATIPYSLGITLAKVALLTVSYFGLSWVLTTHPEWLTGLKWFGAAFLVWRAVSLWRSKGSAATKSQDGFWPGLALAFAIAVSNPQAMLFYIAIVPQVAAETNVWALNLIIAVGFTLISAMYALLAAPIQRLLRGSNQQIVNRFVAGLFVTLAIVFVTR
jgi:threonine/homoserine/homoserine lactone efflux protein